MQYYKVIKQFLKNNHEVTTENINRFLLEKKIATYKFAFFHFLKFLGMDLEYKDILKIKRTPKKRMGVYLDREKLMGLINMIVDDGYRIVAIIQNLTGSRSQDVLSLRRDKVEIKPDGITLHLLVKGMREHIVLIPFPEAQRILDFITDKGDYPFLRGKQTNLTKWVNNNYRHYYDAVKEASRIVGVPEFSTHDFRRNFATDVYKGTNDLFLVKMLLGHSSIETTAGYLQQIQKEEASKKAIEDFRR